VKYCKPVNAICRTVYRHFAPQTFRPMCGRFPSWAIHPTLEILPHRQFTHRYFAPWGDGVKRLWANCPWGKTFSAGWNVYGPLAPHPWSEMSMGRISHGAKSPDTCRIRSALQ